MAFEGFPLLFGWIPCRGAEVYVGVDPAAERGVDGDGIKDHKNHMVIDTTDHVYPLPIFMTLLQC